MADVPLGDATFDTSEGGSSYVTAGWYKTDIASWQSANLSSITFAGKTTDVIFEPIQVNNAAKLAWALFGNAVSLCPEVAQGLYQIHIYDNFACRMITPSAVNGAKILSQHASGYAIDINVNENKYVSGPCKPENCNYSPCILQAAKTAGISWGGGTMDPQLYPGTCDGHHFEYKAGGSNIIDTAINFCQLPAAVAALYPGSPVQTGAGAVPVVPMFQPPAPPPPPSPTEVKVPVINVKIPGLTDWSNQTIQPGEAFASTWIADYLIAIYKYGIIIGSILAILMLMSGGILYITSAGFPANLQKAKSIMFGAVGGLVILMFTNIILTTVSPNLTTMQGLVTETVPGLNNLEASMALNGSNNFGSFEGMSLPTGGAFRSILFGKEVCGNKDGLDLPTYEQRVKKLMPIVDAWKQIGFDQGGAIYVRGYDANCSTDYEVRQEDYQLNAIANIFAAYPSAFNAQDRANKCFPVVLELSKNKKSYSSDAKKLRESHNLASKSCLPYINSIYQKTILAGANKAGMICGDCIGFYSLLFRKCFDRKNNNKMNTQLGAGRGCPDPDKSILSKYVYRFKTHETDVNTKIDEMLANLRFGDVLHWSTGEKYGSYKSGHYFLYTGGVGLAYEILEMGSGGRADLVNKSGGGKKAVANIGMPNLGWSGVRAISDARDFLIRSYGGHRERKACAWRPLDDSHYD
ncbi:M15 family metallopeptidase [Candidatus Falkowbacteria bacterium]|nr:M15 family metallopeptidase [Candidatus Falkowbacteria bacterium]